MALVDPQGKLIGAPLLGENAYEYDFFAGSQIDVMIGDVVIDSCVSIQFAETQKKIPIFGYANQYYTFLADGQVFVYGALSIAFKEAGYLFWPIRRFLNRTEAGRWTSPRYAVSPTGEITQGINLGETGTFSEASRAARTSPTVKQTVEDALTSEHSAQLMETYRELGAMNDDRFEDFAEVFEDAIWWSSGADNPFSKDRLFSNNINKYTNISKEDVLSHRRADQYPPVDIWITYGDMSRQSHNHTVKKLIDVSFIGQSQTIEISGDPTYEVYNFIAKNLA